MKNYLVRIVGMLALLGVSIPALAVGAVVEHEYVLDGTTFRDLYYSTDEATSAAARMAATAKCDAAKALLATGSATNTCRFLETFENQCIGLVGGVSSQQVNRAFYAFADSRQQAFEDAGQKCQNALAGSGNYGRSSCLPLPQSRSAPRPTPANHRSNLDVCDGTLPACPAPVGGVRDADGVCSCPAGLELFQRTGVDRTYVRREVFSRPGFLNIYFRVTVQVASGDIIPGGICRTAASATDVSAIDSASRCAASGWTPVVRADYRGRAYTSCRIPYELRAAVTMRFNFQQVEGLQSFAAVPAQVNVGSRGEQCVMHQEDGFDTSILSGNHPTCQEVFGTDMLPAKPLRFSDSDRLAVIDNLPGESGQRMVMFGGEEVAYSPATAGVPVQSTAGSSSGSSGGGDKTAKGIAIGAAVVAGAVALFNHSGDPDAFTFSPDYGLNYEAKSGHVFHYGSRVDFRENGWHSWWSAGQTNTRNGSGKLRLGSGAEWQGEVFAARLQSDTFGDRNDSYFSLSAKRQFGVWSFAPAYRLDYNKTQTSDELLHSVKAQLVYRADKWTLTNSAGFSGDSFAAMARNAQAKILLRRDF